MTKKVCIIGISGKSGRYMLQHALRRGYTVTGVCRPESVHKLDDYKDQITLFPGRTDDEEVVRQAVDGAEAVLTVMAPWGVDDYASGTARAVLKHADPQARLIFSCGWHISIDGQDRFGFVITYLVPIIAFFAKLFRFVDLADQTRGFELIFNSGRKWTAVRGSSLEEGPSQGLPIWRERAQDPALSSDIMRRIDYAEFMVAAIDNDALIQKAPALVSRQCASAIEHPLPRDSETAFA